MINKYGEASADWAEEFMRERLQAAATCSAPLLTPTRISARSAGSQVSWSFSFSARARRAYENFFALWKHADENVPILTRARDEYARLSRCVYGLCRRPDERPKMREVLAYNRAAVRPVAQRL